ncbi:MAG: leucine-rich repeat domain-containing protein [Prevotella sp.]|nr:leucine-rich repeat domain-containing protein [Prevotella sp.]
MKRKQFFLLCMILLASIAVKAQDLAYTTNSDGTLTITGFASGFTPSENYTLIIPDEIDGKAVTAIKASAFSGKTNFTSLTIGKNVKSIGNQAFMSCTALTGSVVIPKSVTEIGTSIFEKCSNLTAASFEEGYTLDYIPKWFVWGTSITSFVIPSSVKEIHQGAFKNCSKLTSIEIPANVTTLGDEAFRNCSLLTEVTIPSTITSMGSYVFSGCGIETANIVCETLGVNAFTDCNKLTTLNLMEGVKTIKASAFSGCTLLSTVNFANGIQLETIPDNAFYKSGLTSISIPASVKTIGSYAFQECNKLTNVIFPENTQLTTINNYAFRSCALLPSFTMPNSLTTLGSGVFYSCPKLASVTFSNQLTTIPNETFYDCSSLNNVTIPSWIKTIGDRVFMNCTALTSSVVIPNSVTAIGTSMFEGCSNLTTVSFEEGYKLDYIPKWFVWGTSIPSFVIPPSVKEIRQGALKNCTKLTSIEIPANVTTLGGEAFMNCSLLTEVTIPATITSMDSNVFKESGIITANIACETLGSTAFYNCKKLTTVNFLDGVKTIKSGAFSSCTNLSIVSIPASVTTMEASAFWGCSSLSTVNFANGIQLETISETAFYGTALTSITIPASVKTIGGSAFYSCKKLTEVLFPENSQLTTIGSSAFSNCTLLPSFTMPNTLTTMGSSVFNSCSSLATVTFSEQLTSIPNETFYYCTSLDNVTIPRSATSLGNDCFEHCTSLSSIVIPNTLKSIGTDAFFECTSMTEASFEEGYTLDYIPNWMFETTSISTITIPPSVKEIRLGAFKNCTKLESITIPSNITTLGKEAFMNCTKLTNIVLPNSIGTMESDIFKGCNTLQTIDASQCVNVYDWYTNNSIRSGIFNGVPATTKIILPPNSLMTSLGTNDEITPFEFNLQKDEEGYYLIGDANDWDQFVIHSRTNPEINARLTADIDLTGHIGKVGVGYNSSNCKYYMGTFDGQYHKITINDQLNKDYAGGLFYGVKDATIQRLIVDGTIKTSFLHTGGIIGIFNNLTMNDCESRLKITGITTAPQNLYIGGFLGYGEWDIPASFTDCLFSGVIDGGSNVQYCSPFLGFTGRSKYVTYNYCLNNGTFDVDPSSLHVMGDGVYPQPVSSFYIAGNYSSDYVYGTSVSAYQLAQGEIAYNLQGDRTEQHWGQVIGTDPAPVLTNDPNKWVYKINEYKYSNNPNDSGILTDISHTEQSSIAEGQNDEWFTPEGQKLNGRPTAKGIYIRNGRKIIVK